MREIREDTTLLREFVRCKERPFKERPSFGVAVDECGIEDGGRFIEEFRGASIAEKRDFVPAVDGKAGEVGPSARSTRSSPIFAKSSTSSESSGPFSWSKAASWITSRGASARCTGGFEDTVEAVPVSPEVIDARYEESDGPIETRYAGTTPTGRLSVPPRTYDMLGLRVTS